MIGQVYGSKQQIVGLYDAPLKLKQGDAVPLSSLALNLCEQIRSTLQVQDMVALSLRVPTKIDDGSDEEPKTKEITAEEAAEEDGLIVDAFLISSSANPKRTKLSAVNEVQIVSELMKDCKYRDIVDFDDHFNEDVSLDWTNPKFD